MDEETELSAGRAAELRRAIARAQALLEAMPASGDASLTAVRERIATTIETARSRLDSIEADAGGALDAPTAAFERWSRANPWAALGIGAAIGLILGLALSGRGKPPRAAAEP